MAFQNLVRHLVFPVKFSDPNFSDFQFHWENGFRVRVFTYTKIPAKRSPQGLGRGVGGAAARRGRDRGRVSQLLQCHGFAGDFGQRWRR